MMQSRLILVFTMLVLAFSLGGCNKYKTQKKVNNLDKSITSYEIALRWAQHQDAYSYHVYPDGTQPPVDMNRLNEISVTGIDVIEKSIDENQEKAYTKIELNYFNKNEGNLKKLKLEQNWWFSEENNQWFIDGEFPKF